MPVVSHFFPKMKTFADFVATNSIIYFNKNVPMFQIEITLLQVTYQRLTTTKLGKKKKRWNEGECTLHSLTLDPCFNF